MKAIQLENPRRFRQIDVAEPAAPGAGEALVRVQRVGICGTDYGGYLGQMPFFSYPRIPGHELGVEVLAIGAAVTNVKVGDRCSVAPYMNCQQCYSCRQGNGNCCEHLKVIGVMMDGGMTERIVLPARKLHPANKLTAEQCALVETLAIGCHADNTPIIKGVVGWVDLQSATVATELAELSRHPKFVGVRHVVQDEPDVNFMLRPNFLSGIGTLKACNLAYDILIFPKQIPAAVELVNRFPEQPFVLDHMAKPLIKEGELSPWREQIRELAKAPNVWCKVSGMVTEADHAKGKLDDFKPYLDVVFAAFGEDRLMYGSDWPVCLLAASYERVFEFADHYTRRLTVAMRNNFFGGNAARFYRIKQAR